MQRVQTRRRLAPAPTFACTRWRFGRHKRFVLLFAWLTLWPLDRCLTQISQARAISGPLYPAGAGGSTPADPPDDVRRRHPGHEVDPRHPAARRAHEVAAHDVRVGPVGTLDQDVRLHCSDHVTRGVRGEE